MYRGLLFDKHGRVVQQIVQSSPLPIPVTWEVDAQAVCLDSAGSIVPRGELELQCDPPLVAGVSQVEVGERFVIVQVPAGSTICMGPRPVAEFDCVDDFAIAIDTPGDYLISVDSPRHRLATVLLRVVAAVRRGDVDGSV